MSKSWQGNFFEDFELGAQLSCPIPRTVTAGDASLYVALTGDRTPVYCGPSGLLHPLVTFHTVFGQTVRQVSLNARANLGYAGIRWLKPARIGDTLSMEIKIVGLKENSSGTTGIVWVENNATNQDGERIMSFWRWVMVKKKGSDPTKYAVDAVIPEMPKSVPAESLAIFEDAIPNPTRTGGRWFYERLRSRRARCHHFDGEHGQRRPTT